MIKNLFKRAKPTPMEAATPATPATPASLAPTTPALVAVAPKGSALDAFREKWDKKKDASQEVIEGNGGDTDWGAWTEAVKKEENAFAPTVPMPLGEKKA